MFETVRHHRVHDADLYCGEFKWYYHNFNGARLAVRRRRARERVRGMSEGAKRPSESAGEGVAVTGARQSHGRLGHTTIIHVRERIGWGGCGGNWCPAIAESSCPCSHFHERIELVGEEVAVRSARVSRNRLGHTDPVSLGSVDVAPNYT